MSWRIWRWWLAGIIAYLIFLVATFPATYAVAWAQKRLPELQLSGVSGSLWSGTAQEFALHGHPWGGLSWQFDWRAPFAGHWGYHMELLGPGVTLQGRVAGSHEKLWLQDIQGQLPVTRLDPWLPIPSGSIMGTLNLRLKQVLLVQSHPTMADGRVDISDVRLTWPQAVTLGSYSLKLQTQAQGGISGSLLDTGGPLMLQGTLNLTPSGQYHVSGSLGNRDPANTALNDLLRYLPADTSGKHPFNFDGQL